jgi:FkbM family methyltransferase
MISHSTLRTAVAPINTRTWKTSVLSSLGIASRAILGPFGFRLIPRWRTIVERRERLLRAASITVVLDVGANEGQYARQLRRSRYNGRIISFEPSVNAYKKLVTDCQTDPKRTAHNYALGANEAQLEMFCTANSYSSSLLPLARNEYNDYPPLTVASLETVRVHTLDAVFDGFVGKGERVLLKVDAQGYEKAILLGAPRVLSSIAAIEIELSLQELYSGQALLPDIVGYLATHGFVCTWLERGYVDPRSGDLLQMDGLFIRPALGEPT